MFSETTSPFPTRGVIEGFYGVFYTFPERNNLIRFAGKHGFNLYVYAPKNDRQHRNRWWDPYPKQIMDQFARTVQIAEQVGVTFCYAISPGTSMSYTSLEDFDTLKAKLQAFYDLGVRSFSLLLDDISPELNHPADRERYSNRSEAQADLCNRVFAWLQGLDSTCTLSMCPTEYSGSAPFDPALVELGERLHPDIDVFYTGREVCARTITPADARTFGDAIRRRPLIWDNYPVNDLKMASELHIGPILGRDPNLWQEVNGVVVNVMTQAEATKIPLATYADYLAHPQTYQPARSWESALLEAAGSDSYLALHRFAENSLSSCLGVPATAQLDSLVRSSLASIRAGVPPRVSLAYNDLKMYLHDLDEACYHLLNRMENLALRQDLVPWIVLLDLWQRAGRAALDVIDHMEAGEDPQASLHWLNEYMDAIRENSYRIGGDVLQPLIDYSLEHVAKQAVLT